MGPCLSSPEPKNNQGSTGPNGAKTQERTSAVPIDEQRQQEAAANFGLTNYTVMRVRLYSCCKRFSSNCCAL